VLHVSKLRKAYGKLVAVDEISLDISPGECFGLLGPNGAGKTTAITMLVGAVSPDSGQATLDGEPIHLRAYSPKRKIGFVPQEIGLYESLGCRANLHFFGSLYGVSDADLAKSAERVLEIVGLRDRADEPVSNFSGGMKRRLNIACALMHRPKLLVLDEPTVGVDPQSRNAIFETLDNLQRDGMALIYTTHYMEEVERLCDRIAIMDHGKIVATGTLAELLKLLPGTRGIQLDLSTDLPPNFRYPGVEIEGRSLLFSTSQPMEDLPPLLTRLAQDGLSFENIRSFQPSLEQVFLHLTGRSLRD
jgi:ABC-2 type transport system ATP-binding protein